MPVPPDGGYGWIIVLAAFFSNLIVDGVCTSFTEFKGAYSEHFQCKFHGSFSLKTCVPGPVVGGLVNKYGTRNVVVGGAFISGTAFLISVAAPNIYVFMLIYGVMGGVGFGMIYLPAIVAVGYYFEIETIRRSIDNIGWKYTVWILAGLVFLCALFGLLYRPLVAPTLEQKDHELVPLRDALRKMSDTDDYEFVEECPLPDNHDDPVMARLRSALSECENDEVLDRILVKKHTCSLTSDMTSNNDLKASRATLSGPQLGRISARSFAQSLSRLSNKGEASTLSIAMSGVDPQEFARPMNRQDVFYAGSIKNLKEFKQEGNNMQSYRGSVLSIPRSVVGQAVSSLSSRLSRITDDDILDEYYDTGRCKWIPLAIRNAFQEMIDLELLKDSVMLLLCVSNLLGMMGFYIPFVFLKDLAHSHGVSPADSRYLVPVIGVTNTIGRVFFGWLADRGYVSALAINNFSLLACGVLTLIAPLLPTFSLQLTYAALFGFIISAYVCLTSIVLADLLGLEKLTNSFGLLVVARGIASLAGSPFAGLVYDVTQSYAAAFYFAGFVIVVSGLISCAIPFVHKWKRSHGANEGEYCS
ncbi:unnamed protein product [Heligmosomoides polygyrus]|uniref:Major facilitator superfamily (MFS) profile domain-containing protein n=1 Tax=Heligmosomoides polygyrus TaxID=6339 RepID=A0A3P8AXI4_HELPZ|nr:unnamed protein product [Heligmosomoides polygyrus]